jgi:sugar fermentation stimulation protein A
MLVEFPELIPATVIRRYKRFLVDLTLQNGEVITAHCPNSGRMTGCIEEGWQALISRATNPKRKLKYTIEMTNNGNSWIVVNTNYANLLAFSAIAENIIPNLASLSNLKREVKYGESSRIDVYGESSGIPTYIEVKSVTMLNDTGNYCFPDAPTVRGQKHLVELMNVAAKGERAVMLFIIMREDGEGFTTADFIDLKYAKLLQEAKSRNVEIYAYQAKISTLGLSISNSVDVLL